MLPSRESWQSWPPDAKQDLLSRLRELNTETLEQWRDDPVGFSRYVLGSRLIEAQQQILESVRDHRMTAVKSANAVGKTYTAANAAIWWVKTFEPAKVLLAAAPPEENLRLLLWGELEARLRDNPDLAPPRGVGALSCLYGPEQWIQGRAIPVSARPSEREAKFSGVHSPNLLTIIDEADAVPAEIYRAVEANMSGSHDRLLLLFNPRQAAGPVYNMIREGRVNLIELDALSHPNVVRGEDIIPGAVSRRRTVERIQLWSRPLVEEEEPSEDDPSLFQVPEFLDGETTITPAGQEREPLKGGQWRRITNPQLSYMTLARYPTATHNQLIDRAWIAAAQARWRNYVALHGEEPPEGVDPVTGQDVAEMGDDLNALCNRWGGYVGRFDTWAKVDVMVSADRGVANARKVQPRYHFVDATGVGAGVAPAMQRQGIRQAHGIKTSTKPTRAPEEMPEEVAGEFRKLRDQLWWSVREWLRQDPTAMLPPDDDLEDDLLVLTYEIKNGRVTVLSKDKAKQQLQRSPDKGDALALTFAEPPEEELRAPMPPTPIRGARRPDRGRGSDRDSSSERRGKGGLSGRLPDE